MFFGANSHHSSGVLVGKELLKIVTSDVLGVREDIEITGIAGLGTAMTLIESPFLMR